MSSNPRPKPVPTNHPEVAPYFQAGLRNELRIKKCGDCNTFQAYPQKNCGNCLSRNNIWIRVSGKGKIYSYTEVRQTPGPAFAADVPFVLAFVELDEADGIRIMSRIVDVDPRDVYIEMPVQVVFERREDEATGAYAVPNFKPATPRE